MAPELEVLYQEYKDDGLIIITAMLEGGDVYDLGAWASQYGLTYPITAGAHELATNWDVSLTPTEHVIARGGVIYELNVTDTAHAVQQALAIHP